MRQVLISDTSVLIDLGRCNCLTAAFRLPEVSFAVPEILYARELEDSEGPTLRALGLQIVALSSGELALASSYQERVKTISLPDSSALALARQRQLTLLTGDGPLRELARVEGVPIHGVLWLLDELERHAVVTATELLHGLSALKAHPRCRLPQSSVNERLARWRLAIKIGGE